MKDGFDGLVEHLLDGGLFLQQAIEILEKSMIQGALQKQSGQSVRRSKATRHSSQYPAAQDGGVRGWRCAHACAAQANDARRATA